ncbi:hypothetical protein H2200_000346 [Cladophialophora chaetospira]|uniref:Uncharacterized protein n=1 Tax=Cladophialophora chaetospira TaxID=386627 RepID=A0AA38XNC8_9EURO|nr:hypothetical protein H2200_000346 [Cladophialophora chaetospira]
MAFGIPIIVTLIGNIILNRLIPDGSWLPKVPPATVDMHRVRIWAGSTDDLPNKNLLSIAGNLPGVVLYDDFGQIIGEDYYDGWNVPEGNFRDIEVHGKDRNNARAAYIRLDAWKGDAICIAGISITYPDGGQSVLYGDTMTKLCGWPFYPSLTDFPLPGVGPTGYKPWCFWMDGNNKAFPKSVHFHIPDFHANNVTVNAYNNNRDLLCKSQGRMGTMPSVPNSIPIFNPPLTYDPNATGLNGAPADPPTYVNPQVVLDEYITSWPQSVTRSYDDRKRRRSRRASADAGRDEFQGKFVVSNSEDPGFSAKYACETGNLYGPHFVNSFERKFCKTDDHTVWDFCENNSTSDRFDIDAQILWGTFSSGDADSLGIASTQAATSNQVLTLDTRIDMNSKTE